MIDLHCHLDLYPDLTGVIARCREERLFILSVTTTPKAWRGTVAIATGCPRIQTALGFHPQVAHERSGELALFEALLPEAKYVGEVGLDGSPAFRQHWQQQKMVFEHILETTARAGGRPMSIHSRQAADAVLDMLASHPDAGIPILHWFSGSKAQLDRAISLGCWFSVGPAMLTNPPGRNLVAAMPPDRILPETDGPFVTRAGKPLEPSDVRTVVKYLADIWMIDIHEAQQRLLKSLRNLLVVPT